MFLVFWFLLAVLILVPVQAAEISGTAAGDPTKQTDADWMDNRWIQTEVGTFLGGCIDTPGKKTPKGIAIRVGKENAATVCFDTDLLRYSAGWSGGFLEMNARRYGLIIPLKPIGEVRFKTKPMPGWGSPDFKDSRPNRQGPLPEHQAKYRGLFRHGDRVMLSYTIHETGVLDSPWFERFEEGELFTRVLEIRPHAQELRVNLCEVTNEAESTNDSNYRLLFKQGNRTLAGLRLPVDKNFPGTTGEHLKVVDGMLVLVLPPNPRESRHEVGIWSGGSIPSLIANRLKELRAQPVHSLKDLTLGGPPRWTNALVTRGLIDRSATMFPIDTVTLPFENPWKALMFTSGHDFFSNGDVAVCTIHGDVWRVSGLDEKLESVQWKRMATGLYQPLGLKIIRDQVYVLERDQITLLKDLNRDGETDFYQNFNNDCVSAGGGHSYAACLETDEAGNFYFIKCAEDTPHGGTLLRVSANGRKLDVVATGFRNPNGLGLGPGDFLTAADQQGEWVPETRLDKIKPGGFYGYMPMHKQETAPTAYYPPLCWIPRAVDNSAGGQVWVPNGKWGPFSEKMLHLSYGRCGWMMVLLDENRPGVQAGIVPLPGRFQSGVMRGRFSPKGDLYLTGLRGWQTAAVRDGCLQRVRYRPGKFYAPTGFRALATGVELTFSEALDPAWAEDIGSYHLEQWNYRWSAKYGSADYRVGDPNQEGRDELKLTAAKLLENARTVVLEIADFRPAMQLAIKYSLGFKDGKRNSGDFYATINER